MAEPRKGYVSIKRAGRVIGYLNPRRKRFQLAAQGDDGNYATVEVATAADSDEAKKLLKANFDYYATAT